MSRLAERDYVDAAQELDVDLPVIKAVTQVESNGAGFLPDGQVKILFEAHEFSKRTNHKYDETHPHISTPVWNKKLYLGGKAEHTRLQQAVKLNREAALMSASWGMFQIMGYNYAECGFKNIQEFINAMHSGEREQLLAFVQYIKSRKLVGLLQKKKWDKFAEKYNGKRYKENKYDVKLEQAYERFLK